MFTFKYEFKKATNAHTTDKTIITIFKDGKFHDQLNMCGEITDYQKNKIEKEFN